MDREQEATGPRASMAAIETRAASGEALIPLLKREGSAPDVSSWLRGSAAALERAGKTDAAQQVRELGTRYATQPVKTMTESLDVTQRALQIINGELPGGRPIVRPPGP